MNAPHWSYKLIGMQACRDGIEWAANQPNLKTAWRDCNRGDWMLWLLARLGADNRRLVECAAECAQVALVAIDDPSDLKMAHECLRPCLDYASGLIGADGLAASNMNAFMLAARLPGASGQAISAIYQVGRIALAAQCDAAGPCKKVIEYVTAATSSRAYADCADFVREHFPDALALWDQSCK